MPYYDYRCQSCNQLFTVRQHMHDESIKVCPYCGASTVNKVMSPATFSIKGVACSCNAPKNEQASPCCQNCPHKV